MPPLTLASVLQVVIGLGLLNVWLIRAGSATSYRGGDAATLQEEFQVYGLPRSVFWIVGTLKVGAGIALLVGLWVPALVEPAAAVVAVLMVGALAMHVKVGDPLLKSVPAFLMLLMSAALLFLA
jgi:uncharacterized membrane protein YphA (DoxX/SURF4 family)